MMYVLYGCIPYSSCMAAVWLYVLYGHTTSPGQGVSAVWADIQQIQHVLLYARLYVGTHGARSLPHSAAAAATSVACWHTVKRSLGSRSRPAEPHTEVENAHLRTNPSTIMLTKAVRTVAAHESETRPSRWL